MKHLYTIFFTLALISCSKSPLDIKLDELDDVLDNRNHYALLNEERINRLKTEMQNVQDADSLWNTAFQVLELYKNTKIDSAKVYLQLLEKNFSKDTLRIKSLSVVKANILINIGEYSVAEDFERIYTYLSQRLIEANMKKDREILSEVNDHLHAVRDNWKEVMRLNAEKGHM